MIPKLIVLLSLIVLMVSCSSPYDYLVPSDVTPLKDNKQFLKVISKLSEQERNKVVQYLIGSEVSDAFGFEDSTKPKVMTIRNILKEVRDEEIRDSVSLYRKDSIDQAIRLKVEALKAKLNNVLTVTVINLSFIPKDYESYRYTDYFQLTVSYTNQSTDTLSAYKGTIIIKDAFGEEIKRVQLSNDDNLIPNRTKTLSYVTDYNQFKDRDIKLRSQNFSKLKFEWEPEQVILTNGTNFGEGI